MDSCRLDNLGRAFCTGFEATEVVCTVPEPLEFKTAPWVRDVGADGAPDKSCFFMLWKHCAVKMVCLVEISMSYLQMVVRH